MNKFFLVMTLATATLFSCQNSTKPAEGAVADSVATTAEATSSVLSPEQLVADGATLVGKTVELQGKVAHVCRHAGRKCSLVGTENTDLSVQVMAAGKIDSFPATLVDSVILVKGIVRETQQTKENIAKMEAAAQQAVKKAQGEQEEKHCSHSMHKISIMKKWMEENQKDYYPIYTVAGQSYEVVK